MVYLPILVLLCIICSPIIIGIFEKRHIWPYTPLTFDRLEAAIGKSGYLRKMITGALDADFEYLGMSNDAKGRHCKVNYHFLVAPDRSTLAIIGKGTVIGIGVEGTCLFSMSRDGKYLSTVDHQNCIEKDLSGRWMDQLAFNADFPRLYDKHCVWASRHGIQPGAYTLENEIEQHRQALNDKIDRLEALGYIHFIDPERQIYRYTPYGSLKRFIVDHVRGIFRHIKAGRI